MFAMQYSSVIICEVITTLLCLHAWRSSNTFFRTVEKIYIYNLKKKVD